VLKLFHGCFSSCQKFWVLETVARIPYFAYISILHLYESIGFWRAGAELRKIHFAEVRCSGAGDLDFEQSLGIMSGYTCVLRLASRYLCQATPVYSDWHNSGRFRVVRSLSNSFVSIAHIELRTILFVSIAH
jgi:hypothetical protein